jgi:hypothetical protein
MMNGWMSTAMRARLIEIAASGQPERRALDGRAGSPGGPDRNMEDAMADLRYEVSFKGVASPTLRAAFADCDVGSGVGTTWVRCSHDALGVIVARIEELGLELLEVRLLAERRAEDRPPHGR